MEDFFTGSTPAAIFAQLDRFALFIPFLVIPLLLYAKWKALSRREEKLHEIAVRLGLHLHTLFSASSMGQPIDVESAVSVLSENMSSGVQKEDLARALQQPLVQKLIRLAQPWEMSGRIANVDVRAKLVQTNNARSIHFHAALTKPLGFEIALMPEKATQKIGKFLSTQFRDIATDDTEFDAKVFLRGSDEGKIREWLVQGNRKNVLIDFLTANPTATLDQNGLTVIAYGENLDAEAFRTVFESLARAVHQLSH